MVLCNATILGERYCIPSIKSIDDLFFEDLPCDHEKLGALHSKPNSVNCQGIRLSSNGAPLLNSFQIAFLENGSRRSTKMARILNRYSVVGEFPQKT